VEVGQDGHEDDEPVVKGRPKSELLRYPDPTCGVAYMCRQEQRFYLVARASGYVPWPRSRQNNLSGGRGSVALDIHIHCNGSQRQGILASCLEALKLMERPVHLALL